MVQSLNQFLQELLSSPETKYHELFRAFCSEGRAACANEKFSDQLCIYDFQLLSVVGKGSYGKVMQARKKDSGKIYAIKVLLKKDLKKQTQITHTQTERHILGAVTHPFVCSLRYAFQNRTKLYMVMDFFTGGELFFHLNKGPFEEARTRYYIAEITLALEHLHSLLVVYRDLKPENVLLDADGHIKLSDFGLSKKFKKGDSYETRTFCGTPQYVAPEIIHNKGYSFGVDWWAMGCLTYELLTRKPPFEAKNSNALYGAISNAPVSYPATVSPLAKSFISGLLEKNPAQRLGFRGATEIKEHPFFEGMNWNALFAKKLPVPFKPPQDPEDTSCVWKDFLDDEVKDTPTEAPMMDDLVRDLPGFTFAPQTLNTFAGSMAVRNNLLGDTRPD
jgi:serum/glucocorticoid-regulated kinase 2